MLNEKVDFGLSEIMTLKAESIVEYPFHKHENTFEIILVLKGGINLYLVNAQEVMAAGDIQVCNPNEVHYLKGLSDDNVVLFLYINAEHSVSNIHDFRSFIFTTRNIDKNSEGLHKLRASIGDIAEKFYEEKHKKSEVDEHVRFLIDILIEDFQFYFIPDDYRFQANNVLKKNAIQISRIRRANQYIYDNYNKQIKLEDLAEIENITPQYLTNILKRGGGIGFRKLLNMARVEKSAHFLLDGSTPLQSVCYECGFSKYQYFNNSFKKFFDLTPSEFRKKYKDLTIADRAPKSKMIAKNHIFGLLEGMRGHSKELKISLKELNKSRRVNKDISATLDLKNYNHLILFQLIKTATEEISLKNVLLDGMFIAEHKHAWDDFTRIISDLFYIHLNVHITVDEDIDLKKYQSLISFINGYAEKSDKIIKLIIFHTETRGENADKLLELAADNHIEVVPRKKQALCEKPPLSCILRDTFDWIRCGDECNTQSYSLFSQRSSGRADSGIEFALLENSGLKLPSYHTFSMIKKMGKYLVQNAKNYYITTNEAKSDIQFLFCNFAEEDRMRRIVDYDVSITGLDGFYAIREYRFKDDDYSRRFNPGFDLSRLSPECMHIFNESLGAEKSIKFVKSNSNYEFSYSLIPFEILFLSIEKI